MREERQIPNPFYFAPANENCVFEDIVHEAFKDSHRLVGDTSVGVDLFDD